MIEFAPVAPLSIHRQLRGANPELWGRYHLLIASEILKDPIGYNRFWTGLMPPKTVIVDNGVIETGTALPLSQLAAAAVLVEADVVVVPDIIADAAATVQAAQVSIPTLRRLLPAETQLMGVGQGRTELEVAQCLSALDTLEVDWLSIPKGYAERRLGYRWLAMERVRRMFARHLHVLGMTNDYGDDVAAAQYAHGIDSAMPIWLSRQGAKMEDIRKSFFWRRPTDYMDWKSLTDEEEALALYNIAKVREWLNTAPTAPIVAKEP